MFLHEITLGIVWKALVVVLVMHDRQKQITRQNISDFKDSMDKSTKTTEQFKAEYVLSVHFKSK